LTESNRENIRNLYRKKYENLGNFSVCASVIVQTLKDLQTLREKYENGAVIAKNLSQYSESEEIKSWLDISLEALQDHLKLQDKLFDHYETVLKEHEDHSTNAYESMLKQHKDVANNGYESNEIMPEIGEAKPNLVYIKEDQEDDMFIDDGPDISQEVEPDLKQVKDEDVGQIDCEAKVEALCSVEEDDIKLEIEDDYNNVLTNTHNKTDKNTPKPLKPLKKQKRADIEKDDLETADTNGPDTLLKQNIKTDVPLGLTLNFRSLDDDFSKPFHCDKCEKSYKSFSSLKEHIRDNHTSNPALKPFKCDICGKRMVSQIKLKKHKWVHNADDAFPCHLCTSTFKALSYYRNHMRKWHPGEKWQRPQVKEEKDKIKEQLKPKEEKLHTCEECGRSFQKANLKRHMLIHKEEKGYLCDICSKSFATNTQLLQHKISHIEEKNIACDVCGDLFSHRKNLLKHKKRVHTVIKRNYSCEECGKSYKSSCMLKQHLRIHTGETPYSCDECGESFRTYNIWTRHKGKHKRPEEIKE